MITLIYDLFNEIFKMGNWGVTNMTNYDELFMIVIVEEYVDLMMF